MNTKSVEPADGRWPACAHCGETMTPTVVRWDCRSCSCRVDGKDDAMGYNDRTGKDDAMGYNEGFTCKA